MICIIFFAIHTILDVIEYNCPKFNDSAEFIIQVVAPTFKTFGVNVILFHSFSVGVYKYYIILINPILPKGPIWPYPPIFFKLLFFYLR